MTKDTKSSRSAPRDKVVISPIGGRKAAKFALVEGLTMNADSKALARKLAASGLKGDAYRSEIIKAFKKG
ncbi:hypothetical protein SAMN05428983_4643 [Agrobacterium fabrum]|jgi:hypothetical protein|uniref:Uncharacterized protein n=1 Tax=Agrobacterium fabrum TaxID=1176649 RepID=A0A7Z7BRU7_9HYPH|nr:hypothetical protein [Agrobacterium fabrum]SDK33834.1 hypothetical protein SAMN05428983_4643 [Agrobacterium fabrum]